MKTLLTAFLALIICQTPLTLRAQENKKYTLSDELLRVEFNTTWTWDDITVVKQELKEHEIELKYSLLEFDDSGFLKRITASITYKDGMTGSFESRELQSDGPGFRRNFIKHPIRQN